MMQRIFRLLGLTAAIILIFALSSCTLIEIALNATPVAPEMTATSLINIASLPTLPRLAAKPSATPDAVATETVNSAIRYDNAPDIFRGYPGDEYFAEKGVPVRLKGIVETVSGYSFELDADYGVKLAVHCDGGCFLTDRAKIPVAYENVTAGNEVIVYGATDPDTADKVIADLIVVHDVRPVERADAPNPGDLYFPAGIHYTEYRLKDVPSLNPLSFETTDPDFDVEANLAERLKLSLAERNEFAYGAYGEIYSAELDYTTPSNRAAGYPTRSRLTMYANGYEFFSTFIPQIPTPYDAIWGDLNYGGDWYLPLRFSVDINPDPKVEEIVTCDRTIMSQMNFERNFGYIETFGYSILNYNLFYFFRKANGIGFALNRTNYELGFDDVIFGEIKPFTELNPFYSDYRIGFFGRRGETWYYAEVNSDIPTYYY